MLCCAFFCQGRLGEAERGVGTSLLWQAAACKPRPTFSPFHVLFSTPLGQPLHPGGEGHCSGLSAALAPRLTRAQTPVKHQCTSPWPAEGCSCVLSHTPSCSLRGLWTAGVGDWVLHSHAFPGEPGPVLQTSFTRKVQLPMSEGLVKAGVRACVCTHNEGCF